MKAPTWKLFAFLQIASKTTWTVGHFLSLWSKWRYGQVLSVKIAMRNSVKLSPLSYSEIFIRSNLLLGPEGSESKMLLVYYIFLSRRTFDWFAASWHVLCCLSASLVMVKVKIWSGFVGENSNEKLCETFSTFLFRNGHVFNNNLYSLQLIQFTTFQKC